MPMRSCLFVPATRAQAYFEGLRRVPQAHALPDGVILDLEDSVAEVLKPAARALLDGVFHQALPRLPAELRVYVRINGRHTAEFEDDLAAVRPWACHGVGVMIPKCGTGDDLAALLAGVPALAPDRVMPLVETLEGLQHRDALMDRARRLGLRHIAFGAGDMSLALGIERDYDLPLMQQVIMQLVLSAKLHGLALIDAPSRIIPSAAQAGSLQARLEAECRWSCANGLVGKLAVHPRQVALIHEAFDRPGRVEWARRVLADFARSPDSRAVVSSADGSYMGTPTLKEARAILAEHERGQADGHGAGR